MASSHAIAAVGRRLRGTMMIAAMRTATSKTKTRMSHQDASKVIATMHNPQPVI